MSRRLLLDTNVWLDFFVAGRPGSSDANKLVLCALEKGYDLLVSSTTLGDLFYLVRCHYKGQLRDEVGSLSEAAAYAADEMAWSAIDGLTNLGLAVGVDDADFHAARSLRSLHGDLEDNLVVAAAMRSDAMLVSGDKKLVEHAPASALSVADALKYVEVV